jgi:L-arabinose isomerase
MSTSPGTYLSPSRILHRDGHADRDGQDGHDGPNGKMLQSFEVAEGETFGDLVSPERLRSTQPIKVGLLAGGFFEYWRMYPGTLKSVVEKDADVVFRRLGRDHDIVYPGLVDSMDTADEAGRRFRDAQIDMLIITERTYVPDTYIHQVLSHLNNVPLLLFVSQAHDTLDLDGNYEATLRDSGMMSLVQLVAGFRKMGIYDNLQVVVGGIHDEDAYRQIEGYIRVVETFKQLRTMTVGVVGHVFRGMFDFEYDKTMVKGAMGPEVIYIQINHLLDLWKKAGEADPAVRAMVEKVYANYHVDGVGEDDIMAAARVAVAMKRLVQRFRLDGLVLLGQHYVEAQTKATSYLGMAELHAEGKVLGVTEGDVIGLVMMKVLRSLTGLTPFFGEWGEFDVHRNIMMLLGHGYADPTQAAHGLKPRITPSPEQWGLEGNGFNFEMTFEPGQATLTHCIRDHKGWRMLISGGQIVDLPAMPIHDCSLLVKLERPIKEYVELLVKQGFAHHAIAVRGDVRKELGQLADLMGMEKVIL